LPNHNVFAHNHRRGPVACRYSFIAFRLLVALLLVRALLFRAKDLFIAAIVPGPTFLRAASPHARRTPVGLLRFLGRFAPVRDLLLCAKDLFVGAILQPEEGRELMKEAKGLK
jgi:hypothetical protein